jgi:hypothetical protein
MSHSLGLASHFAAELATIRGPLLERSGFFVSMGSIALPTYRASEMVSGPDNAADACLR